MTVSPEKKMFKKESNRLIPLFLWTVEFRVPEHMANYHEIVDATIFLATMGYQILIVIIKTVIQTSDDIWSLLKI